jgi:methyl-accepting chemotaxis protein
MESVGSSTTLQNLINQVIELIRSNQKIVNDVIRSNSELRNELSKLPSKLDTLIGTINNFLSLVEAAGKEEVSPSQQVNADALKIVVEELKKISEQNQKIVESNQSVSEELDRMRKRSSRSGLPVSTLLSNYPIRRDIRNE